MRIAARLELARLRNTRRNEVRSSITRRSGRLCDELDDDEDDVELDDDRDDDDEVDDDDELDDDDRLDELDELRGAELDDDDDDRLDDDELDSRTPSARTSAARKYARCGAPGASAAAGVGSGALRSTNRA